ncbi:MAG TPA: tetratricopeptide repeat-containing sensor histidine kinase [Ohtaekwangia sp.]|uniref:ATP-binding protein n=1 Tax=Ohtaekwangia sp. TaxID=2066019 RepID=UPI002F932446
MKKTVTTISCILLCWTSSYSQNLRLIDSLKTSIKHSADDKRRFELLNDLAWEYRWASPDSTILYSNKALTLGRKLNLSKGLAESFNFIGVAYNYKGNRISAFEAFDEALRVSIEQKDSAQIAHSNNNLGRLFFEQGILSRSYEYFIRAMALFEAINDSSGLAYTYQSLAGLYKLQHDYSKAENNYLKAYRIRLSLHNTRDIMSALGQLGRLAQEINQHDKALHFLHLADSAGQIIHDEINLADIKTYIAESYLAQGLLQEAEAICKEGLKVIIGKNNVRMLPEAYITMGRIKFAKNELPGAKKYIDMARDMAAKSNDLSAKMKAYYWLWKLSEKEHDKIGGLQNQNHYLILRDSIKDLDLTRQVERLQFEIEIQRKEQENKLLKANHETNEAIIQQQKLQNIVLIVIVAFVSILGLVQWRNNKKRREINEKLAQQNQFIQNQRTEIVEQNEKLSKRNIELSDINHEKDTLMSIVAHDLKSPLNRIKGIADLMEMENSLSEENKVYVQMTKDATQAGLDLIKDLLDVHMLEENAEPNYSTFDISKFLLEKIQLFTLLAESKNIHLHISRIENSDISIDASYLNRIVDNLISNAIKFSKRNSVVDVSAGRSNSHFWISVKDQGPGFSERDKKHLFQKFKKLSAQPTAGETSNGLGLAIVKTLVDRLKGDIELISKAGKGSEFIVKFPA